MKASQVARWIAVIVDRRADRNCCGRRGSAGPCPNSRATRVQTIWRPARTIRSCRRLNPAAAPASIFDDVALLAAGVGSLPPVLRQHARSPMMLGSSRLPGLIEGEGHLAVAGRLGLGHIGCSICCRCGLCAFSVSNDQTTSSVVIGVPSCQLAFGFRRNFAQEKSSG